MCGTPAVRSTTAASRNGDPTDVELRENNVGRDTGTDGQENRTIVITHLGIADNGQICPDSICTIYKEVQRG
jgi:hypothetical protein